MLKLIDFGDSRIIEPNEIYSTCIGTINYMSPEMLRERTGNEIKKSDMWSIGVITFILITGRLPFHGHTTIQTLNKIKTGDYNYPKKQNISSKCKDFIDKLLILDTNKRMSCNEALNHEWIRK